MDQIFLGIVKKYFLQVLIPNKALKGFLLPKKTEIFGKHFSSKQRWAEAHLYLISKKVLLERSERRGDLSFYPPNFS